MESAPNITQLLQAWQSGDESARNELFDLVYADIHDLASKVLRHDRMAYAVQPTELVNECALRLLGISRLVWRDRLHFISVVAATMRRVLVDEVRRRRSAKRDAIEVTLSGDLPDFDSNQVDLMTLDLALDKLAEVSRERAQIVELKFFGGISNEDVAELLDLTVYRVKEDWRVARIWLADQLPRNT